MAYVEPMDVDNIASDFDDKENSLYNSNVFPKTPSTEKGYEELDVSELDTKLRCSITPTNIPMSRSYNANCKGDSGPNSLNNTQGIDNNLTRSLNSTVTKTDILKSPKLPLQSIPTSLYANNERRLSDTGGNVTVTISGLDNDDNLSLPSTSSSAVQTPEATTPTKEIPKSDGSPIMRGLKSVLNMFRTSHSPLPPSEDVFSHENACHGDSAKNGLNTLIASTHVGSSSITDNNSSEQSSDIVRENLIYENPYFPTKETVVNSLISSKLITSSPLLHETTLAKDDNLLTFTPIANSKIKESNSSRRNSPLKESVVFNEGLERELQWQDETEIFFKNEKIPIQKLLFQTPLNINSNQSLTEQNNVIGKLSTTIEHMDDSNADVSYKSVIEDKNLHDDETKIVKLVNNEMSGVESDTEFVDCETTFIQNKSYILETSQESKMSSVVFQIENIPHEICHEEYIESTNNSNNIDSDELLNDNSTSKTINSMSKQNLDVFNDLPRDSEFAIPIDSCQPPVADTNQSFSKAVPEAEVVETTTTSYVSPMKKVEDVVVADIINSFTENNPSTTLESKDIIEQALGTAPMNLSLEKSFENNTRSAGVFEHIPNSEQPITKNQFNENQYIEDSYISQKTQVNHLGYESCVKNRNDFTDFKFSDMFPNVSSNNMIIKEENDINLDTDVLNTTRILFQIDELLLNKINNANLDKGFISSKNESKTEYKSETENSQFNTSENSLPYERAISDTKVSITKDDLINEDTATSIKMNEISKMVEELNEDTLVLDENTVGDNSSTKKSVKTENLELQNIVNTSDFNMNVDLNASDSIPDEKDNIHVMECESHTVAENKANGQPIICLINNDYVVPHIQNVECSHDITMDSLEPNLDLTYDQVTCKINKTDIYTNIDYVSNEQNNMADVLEYNKTVDSKNTSPVDLPLPLDVPLPCEDDIEKDSLLDQSFENRYVGVISEIEAEKRACVYINTDLKETKDHSNLSEPLNDKNLDIAHNYTFNNCSLDKMLTNSNMDVEMATVQGNIIQDTPFVQLSTNLTTDLQHMNLVSNNKDLQQISKITSEIIDDNIASSELTKQKGINVDIKTTVTTLPDVVQAVKISKNNDTNTEEIKRNIMNETICLEDNNNEKDIDEEVVISAGNSPYVSVAELDLNISTNVVKPVDESENLNQPEIQTVSSPPISPRLTRKGYNINFDEIENPFATKTNIRMSPPPGTPNKSFTPVNNNHKNIERRTPNKRQSQSEGNKSYADRKRFNKSIDRMKSNDKVDTVRTEYNEVGQGNNVYDFKNLSSNVDLQKETDSTAKSETDYLNNAIIQTSSVLEKQIVSHKSNEKITLTEQNFTNKPDSSNVFDIPEIDDMNFDPFATKSKVCVTPPPTEFNDPLNIISDIEIVTDLTNENAFNTVQQDVTLCVENHVLCETSITKQENFTPCMEDSIQNEGKISSITSDTTSSSINTDDKDVTVRELNTEDEDTIEGPFFEAEDLVAIVKVPEVETEEQSDTMQFEDLPSTSKSEDIDKGELFIDAEAFDFLLNQNKTNTVVDSGKESLFLKFDPLFAKGVSSDGIFAALSTIQKKKSTPKKMAMAPLVRLAREETSLMPIISSDVASVSEGNNEEIISAVSKPMMVVNPAVAKQPVATPRISLTPKINRQSLNFASPAMVAIDRLLSLSGNTSLLDQEVTNAGRNHEANVVLVQLRELLAEKDLHVHSLKCESEELRDRLATLETQVKSLENEGEERLRKVTTLNEHLTEKTKINKSMAVVVEEYERTIASLISEMEHEKKRNAEEKMRLINERDEQTAHLASMEGSFSDLHSKYEKCKQIILSMKANEDGYKKSFKEFDENLLKMQKNYDLLKQHATSKLNHANHELEKMNRAHDAEVLKLTSIIKRKDLHITSLEESLTQKSKANEELSAICDELINKVG